MMYRRASSGMYTYRACIIHLGMYTHNGRTVGPCAQIITHSILKTRCPRYPRVVNTYVSGKGISSRRREPETGNFNKPNSEQFSLLFDTLENSSPCERVRLCVKLLDTRLTRKATLVLREQTFSPQRLRKRLQTSLAKFIRACKCTRACIVYVRNL